MATIYYVDPSVGDDGNLGTSEGIGNAWETIQYALDQMTVAGDICYVKASATISTTANIDVDITAGTAAAPIRLIGYTSTPGDCGQVTIQASSSHDYMFICTQDYHTYENFILDGNGNITYDGFYASSGDNCRYINLEIDDMGRHGMLINDYNIVDRCYIHDIGGWGIDCDPGDFNKIMNSVFATCVSGAITADNHNAIIGNLFYNNSGFAIDADADSFIMGNTIVAGALGVLDGINLANSFGDVIMNNIITGFDTGGKFGIVTANPAYLDGNAFYTNDGDVSGSTEGPDTVTLSANPFVNATSDFSLNETAGGGLACRNAGITIVNKLQG